MEALKLQTILDWVSKHKHVDNPFYTAHEESGFAVFGFTYKNIEVSIDNDGDVLLKPNKLTKKSIPLDDLDKITILLNTLSNYFE